MPKRHRAFQRNRLGFGEAPDREPAQLDDMAERAERRGKIAGQRADIGAFPDRRLELGMVRIGSGQQPQLGNLHRASASVRAACRRGPARKRGARQP